jgi:hypothetical protein
MEARECEPNTEDEGGCIKPVSQSRKDAAEAAKEAAERARNSTTNSSGRNTNFLGITDWSGSFPYAGLGDASYINGLANALVPMLMVMVLAATCLETLCCFRCPLGTDHRSEDSFGTMICKCCASGTACCIEDCHPRSEDSACEALLKFVLAGPFCVCCCCNCNCNCCCCAPAANVVMTQPDGLDEVTVFNGGLSAAGEQEYTQYVKCYASLNETQLLCLNSTLGMC